jgi:hypothetical protein
MNQKVIISLSFWSMSDLNPFNCETAGLNGGAFRLRAVGAYQDGRPKRSKEYLLFTDGMFSMVL